MNYDEKDDLFDLFRDTEQALDEMPPDTAWQQLESRLQLQKKSTNQRRPRLEVPTMVIVLVLVVLLLCGFLGVYFMQKAAEKDKLEQIGLFEARPQSGRLLS